MNIINFTPISAFVGGSLIGFAAFLFFAFNGRMAGVSAIASGSIINNENRFENYDLDFHVKIRKAFLKIANRDKKRCKVINAELSEKEISDIIKNEIDKKININN